jgi:uncharacterized protein (DUF58 family)
MVTAQRIVLILLALSLLAGISTGGTVYYRLSYLWALLFFGGWLWSALSLRGLRLERSARTLRAQVGQVFEERFEIQNDSRLPHVWLEIRDNSSLPGAKGSHVMTMLEGRQSRSYLARTRLIQRGAYPLGPTDLASGDLFGMFPISRAISAKDTLLVYPLIFDLTSFPNPAGLLPGGEALRRRTHQITPNAAGIREYTPGDPLNRIHWVSTARRDRLMVKEFELDPLADVWIFLDAARSVQAALPQPPLSYEVEDFWKRKVKIPLPPSTEEYSVSIAASLARYLIQQERAVGLVSAGQHLTLLPPDRGGRQLSKILEALALSQANGSLPLRGLLETQARHITRGSTVILITPSAAAELALVADHLLRQGLRPIAILLDGASFGGYSSSNTLADKIKALGVPVCQISNRDEIEVTLSQPDWRMVERAGL